MPGVSVIIPSYNSAPYLAATIGSALAQTEPAADVTVIDDGSSDETAEVCQPFLDRIQFVCGENRGVSISRNHGAEIARGQWLLFLDSDDRLLPHALASLRQAAEEAHARVAYGYVLLRAEDPLQARLNSYPYAVGEPPEPALRNFWRAAIVTPGAAIVHRSLHEEIGGFVDGYQPMEDRDYWIKAGVLSRFAFADTCVLDKTWRAGSAGSNTVRKIVRGLRAQLAFLDWCAERKIDSSFLKTDRRGLIEHAIKETMWERAWPALPQILDVAREEGIRPRWQYRARLRQAFDRFSAR